MDAQVVRDFSDSAGKEYQCLDDVDYEAGPEGHDHASLALNAVEEKHEASTNNKNGHFLMISLEFHLCDRTHNHFTDGQRQQNTKVEQNYAVVLIVNAQMHPDIFHNQQSHQRRHLQQHLDALPF